MPQNNTDTANQGELTPKQQQVLEYLLAGDTVTAAAKAVGVDRTTVHRWCREDFAFQAAHNRGRRELRDALDARLHALGQKATEAVESALERGDARTAMNVLKGLGLLGGEQARFGPEDPRKLRASAEDAEKRSQKIDTILTGLSNL